MLMIDFSKLFLPCFHSCEAVQNLFLVFGFTYEVTEPRIVRACFWINTPNSSHFNVENVIMLSDITTEQTKPIKKKKIYISLLTRALLCICVGVCTGKDQVQGSDNTDKQLIFWVGKKHIFPSLKSASCHPWRVCVRACVCLWGFIKYVGTHVCHCAGKLQPLPSTVVLVYFLCVSLHLCMWVCVC